MSSIVAKYGDEMHRLSAKLEQALTMLYQQAQEAAKAEVEYRQAHATAALKAEGTVDQRKARADLETTKQLFDYRLAGNMLDASKEAVRSRRAQISLLQSAIAAERVEAEFDRTGPQ